MSAFGQKQWDGLLLTLNGIAMCQTGRMSVEAVHSHSKKESVMKLTRVGIDLAKNVFQVHGVDEREKPVWKRRLKRATWLRVF
jgi:hypothetical protein